MVVENSSLLTSGRLLVATILLPETISFQVPTRDKDGKYSSQPRRSLSGQANLNPTVHSATATGAPTAAIASEEANQQRNAPSIVSSIHPLTSSIAAQHTLSSRRGPPCDTPVSPSSPSVITPPPTSPSFFRTASASGEAVIHAPRPISSKADRLKEQDRPPFLHKSPNHDHTPPPSILEPPTSSEKEEHTNVFPPSAPRPALNQPRSRTSSGVYVHTATPSLPASQHPPERRVSIDTAKVYADAPWTVEKAGGGNFGLYNAVNSIQNQLAKTVFVGTLGMPTDVLQDRTRGDIRVELALNHNSIPVFVLWPIFHYVLPDNFRSKGYEDGSWKHYVAVNRAFADTIVENYIEGDTIWVNDYHLMLVPNMIREQLPDATIGFFLHIPFPSSEIFRCLHVREEVLEGLLGADMIGFQTYSFARHFLQTCTRLLAYETSPKGIQLENTAVNVGIFPIGIDTQSLAVKRKDPEVAQWVKEIKERYSGMKLIVARDKLDYVKGVRQKMLAFERFLNLYPEWNGKIVLIQVALSTSEQNEVQGQVSDVVTRINSKFSSLSYQPIVFLRQDITFSQYLGLLTAADLCLITSLRDGMNLTSHEYVFCQEEERNPLVLSEFAGTYGSMGACLRVNPWNYTEVAEAIHEALVMKAGEKALRWHELNMHVVTNTAQFWATDFVSELVKVHSDVQRRYSIHIPLLTLKDVLGEYRSAQTRLFLLDYDGTLLPYEKPSVTRLRRKAMNDGMFKTVRSLAQDPRNIVYIMSGRTKESLDELFGSIPDIGLCAEGGCFLKFAGKAAWEDQIQEGSNMQWREKVMEMFEYYMERTPGSEIEEKSVPIVWHYRQADNPTFGLWQARECQNHIEEAIGSIYPIHAVVGRKCVEVMPRDVSKSQATKTIVDALRAASANGKSRPPLDFVVSIGDDRSDEDMFKYCNGLQDDTGLNKDRIVTVTVGSKSSAAKWFVPGVSAVLQNLQTLAQA
ncbi:hypothetical protein BGZ93_007155 [Podila epicladia]|nr:hypothetical protein BGZ92_007831 [Podila epicladia]KAG0094473.1 hypothetical protein BGZ93_007155 [Podila epicladia]